MHAAPLILKYLARAVIQDAAGGMSRVHRHHGAHVLLNTPSVFRSTLPAMLNSWLLITMIDSSAML